MLMPSLHRSKRNCFKCNVAKPIVDGAFKDPVQQHPEFFTGRIGVRPGDWYCPECGAHNFRDKLQCFSCCTVKPQLSPQVGQFPPEIRFNRAKSQYKRYITVRRRPQTFAFGYANGEWVCSFCSNYNYNGRICHRCSAENPTHVRNQSAILRPYEFLIASFSRSNL